MTVSLAANLLERVGFVSNKLSEAEIIEDIHSHPEEYFQGYYGRPLKWSNTVKGLAPMYGLSDDFGLRFMPNITCLYEGPLCSYFMGWVEDIHQNEPNVVTIKHIALDKRLAAQGLGVKFVGGIARFFGKHGMQLIRFEEHNSDLERREIYDRFFAKIGAIKTISGHWVWKIDHFCSPDLIEKHINR